MDYAGLKSIICVRLNGNSRMATKKQQFCGCQNHHPRVKSLTFQVPALPPIPNHATAATGMELDEYSIPSFQHEDHVSVYTGGGG